MFLNQCHTIGYNFYDGRDAKLSHKGHTMLKVKKTWLKKLLAKILC